MNLRLERRNADFPSEEIIERLSKSMKLHPKLAELLVSRGIDNEEKAKKYLYPDKNNFYDPFLLKGMAQAVERINLAIQNNEKIVIYGDYDADGICASAILALYLSSCGLNVYTHIPSRIGDGYGLNVDSIEKIIDSECPDIILTCDCGISGYAEVEYALDLGVDVIITDHHEVSELIPNCTVINPKQTDCAYPYAYLCGAGVAMKLVHALGGLDAAMKYIDLAAIATIADLVPLLDENRLIVQMGLDYMKQKKNLGLSLLFEDQKLTYPASSGDIAYKIAPRINAAGRMGDAYRAFELLTLDDRARVEEILKEINDDNTRRKELCDQLYAEAVVDLQSEDIVDNRSIILSNPNWEKGITGILAARLAGDFHRPSFIMVNSGGQYKGTSRSIAGINIYDLLTSMSDVLIEFGGHSQAAGFSIKEENIPLFRARVNEYLRGFSQDLFEPSLEYDLDIELDELNLTLAKSLVAIEPAGNSNAMPLFRTVAKNLAVTPCKNNYMHTNITAETGLQMIAFNFHAQNQFLIGDDDKQIVLELQLNTYGGRESAKGILRGVAPQKLYINDEVAKANFLKTLSFKPFNDAKFTMYDSEDLAGIVGDDIFGALIIAGCKKSYEDNIAKFSPVLQEFLYTTYKNNYSRIIISPDYDENLLLANYNKIIFLDTPPANAILKYINKKSNATVYVPRVSNEGIFYNDLSLERSVFGRYFDAIRRNANISAVNILSYFKLLSAREEGLNIRQFVLAVMVFTELGIVSVQKGNFKIVVNKEVRRELGESEIYNYVCKM